MISQILTALSAMVESAEVILSAFYLDCSRITDEGVVVLTKNTNKSSQYLFSYTPNILCLFVTQIFTKYKTKYTASCSTSLAIEKFIF